MANKVLVAYASKYGATTQIAEKIGEVLCQAGLQVDVLPADRIKDMTPYNAVVLGSAVYIGMWRKEAVTFIKKNEPLLVKLPVWLFSSGPSGDGDAIQLMKGWQFPEAIRPFINHIKPREITVFHGAIDINKMNFLEKLAIKNIKAPVGDFRNWDAITTWARGIAEAVKNG